MFKGTSLTFSDAVRNTIPEARRWQLPLAARTIATLQRAIPGSTCFDPKAKFLHFCVDRTPIAPETREITMDHVNPNSSWHGMSIAFLASFQAFKEPERMINMGLETEFMFAKLKKTTIEKIVAIATNQELGWIRARQESDPLLSRHILDGLSELTDTTLLKMMWHIRNNVATKGYPDAKWKKAMRDGAVLDFTYRGDDGFKHGGFRQLPLASILSGKFSLHSVDIIPGRISATEGSFIDLALFGARNQHQNMGSPFPTQFYEEPAEPFLLHAFVEGNIPTQGTVQNRGFEVQQSGVKIKFDGFSLFRHFSHPDSNSSDFTCEITSASAPEIRSGWKH